MMSWRTWAGCLASALLMAACGGGGSNAGTPALGGGTGTLSVADLAVTLSSPTMPNTATSEVVATVTAVDANRATLADVPVTLSVDSGATIQASGSKTNPSGQVSGTVKVGSDTTPRRITVTATSGSLTRTAVIDVTATTASDLSLTLSPSAILSNSGTASVLATVTAVDANRATVANIPVTLSVNSGATIQTSAAVTDVNGQVSGSVRIGDDKSNRTITVTAVSGALTRTASIQVIGAKINATVLGAVLAPGQTGSVQYRLVDANANPIANSRFTVTGPDGVQTVATTGTNGDYNYSFKAPDTSGSLDIRSSAAGVENVVSIQVNTGAGTIPVVTDIVRSASTSASPSVVAVNSPTTSNRSELRALFLSDSNAPVKNVRVRFDLNGDVNSIGGTFTSGTTQVYSDANGVATSAYVPGARFSPTDGVTVRACWDYSDFAVGACPNSATTTLTVISDALSVTIGTNELIGDGSSGLTYVKRYVVQVVDSSGLAAKDVEVSASVDLLQYLKGFWTLNRSLLPPRWEQTVRAACGNEDLNRNGVAEVFSNGVKEDANDSFNLTPGRAALEPRKADVAISFEGPNKTNASGQVVLRIEYPRNTASWVNFNIVVAASGVAGTEGRANYESVLPVPASAVIAEGSPAFQVSPYGTGSSPVIAVSQPGSAQTVLLCTNPL